MVVTASAPGKLMLFGEHAVVYHRPCLVTAVGLRVNASVEVATGDTVAISTPKRVQRVSLDQLLGGTLASHETAFVEAAVAQALLHYKVRTGLSVSTHGPAKSFGLGSSSAITVATVGAVVELLGIKPSQRELFDLSYAAVLAVQGKGSGFDVASAIYGGTLYFVTGGEEIEPLAVKSQPVVIGYSGEKVGTVGLVDGVSDLRQRYPGLINQVFDTIGSLVNQARDALIDHNWHAVGDLMNLNQGLLDALGVSTPQLANPIFAAREAGALGAKLSGAGGGDCMFAVVEDQRRLAVEQAIQQAGAQVVNLELGAQGVRIE